MGKPSGELRTLFWEYGRNNTSFVYPAGKDKSPNLAVRDGNWKLLMNSNGDGIELYDMVKDNRETTNIAEKNLKIVENLKIKLTEWRRSLPELK